MELGAVFYKNADDPDQIYVHACKSPARKHFNLQTVKHTYKGKNV